MRLLLVAVFALVIGSGVRALPPDKNKDATAKAKAILALSTPCPECPTVTKAKTALATSGLVVAPMPTEKHVSAAAPKDGKIEKMTVDLDCSTGTCHPLLPGYARGTDGIYRPTGVVPQRERR